MTTLTAGASAPAGGATSTRTAPMRHATRVRAGGLAKELVLAVVGILGLLGIAWLLCAWLFGLSIVVFKTGSMSPTIPTGSAAVVRDVPASTISIGDVITVRRDSAALPVTHRVVGIEQDPASSESRIVTLKGDANSTADLDPYVISETKVVVASMAGAGTVLAILRTPFVLALTTLIVALLAIWAFWPQRRTPERVEPELAVPKPAVSENTD